MKILIAVWGEAYILRLERFGFSSFLAPGNLPELARRCDVELVILTCARDVERFEELPLIAAVRQHAGVRYVTIDDLIAPGHYSTTLTLAFTRGVAAFGAAMTSMHFVFWNADFVLSNGAFAHLADLIGQGKKVIITGTLRAVADQAEPLLDARREDASSPLTASSRELVALAFRFQHPHHVAKTVNQDVCWTTMPSQMLWRVDNHTTLGRFFKAFMFCLRPTRVVTTINGPCDYSFVPEYCPGEPQTLIGDSDDAFILELQPRDSESEFIRLDPRDEDVRRRCMEEWLTPEHLDTGSRVVVVRSGATPDSVIETARKGFKAYFDGFMASVAPPSSHIGQYYWVFGCAAWKAHRDAHIPDQPLPRELEATLTLSDLKHPTYRRWQAKSRALGERTLVMGRGLKSKLRVLLFGRPFEPAGFHPDAPAQPVLRAVAEDIRAAVGEAGSVVTLAEGGQWPDLAFPISSPNVYRMEPRAAQLWSLRGPQQANAALIYAQPNRPVDLAALVERLSGALVANAPVTIVLHDAGWKGKPEWLDDQLRSSLALHGLLDDLKVRRHEGQRRQRRFAAVFYWVLERVVNDNRPLVRLALAMRLAPALLGRALGLGSRAPSGRTIVAVVSGRLRSNDMEAAA